LKVLVTGGRGFIGSFLVERLLQEGHTVRCLLRRKPSQGWLSGLSYEACEGDITAPESLAAAVRDVGLVFHLAGCTRALTAVGFHRINVDGTRNLLAAVEKHNPEVRRIVHISSLAAAGPSPDGHLLSETEAPLPVSEYGRSKLASERVASEFMRTLPVTIVRPPAVYGPRERDVFGYFKQAKRGLFLVLGGGPRTASFVFVRDLVAGLMLAATHPAAVGQTFYICDDTAVTWEAFGRQLAQAFGVKPRYLRLPSGFALPVCAAGEVWSQLTHNPLIMNLDKYREIRMRHWACSNEKARRELGFAPAAGLQRGVEETAAWYLENGWL